MVWHNLRMYIHESHSYRCSMVYLWVYAVLWKSVNPKIFRGLRPLDPPAGALPLHPARGPWTPPKIGSRLRARYVRSAHMFASQKKKSARAYALAMCAPRTCLPPKKIGSRLRARYVRSAHMLPKKNRTPAIQKNRLALRARYVRYAHMFAPP